MSPEEKIRDELLTSVKSVLGSEVEIDIDDNLLALGLESLQTMRLLAGWMKQGYRVSSGDFMSKPTIREWAELLARESPGTFDDTVLKHPVLPVDDSSPFDLTDVQYAYWIGRDASQSFGGVGTHGYVEIEANSLDIDRLQHSWETLLQSHPMLRACYTKDGKQYVLAEPAYPAITVHDLTHLSPRSQQEALAATREHLSHRLLAIGEGQVVSLEVSKLSNSRAIIHFDIDLLVSDVQSFQIILRDLAHHYATGEAPIVDPSWSFARYLAERAQSDSAIIDRDRRYWQSRLAELPSAPTMPMRSVAAGSIRAPRFVRRQYSFAARTWQQLRELSDRHKTTPAMVLLTAYARTVGQWSDDKRFLISVPLFNRDSDPAVQNVVADFTTLTLTSIDQTSQRTFVEDLELIQRSFYRDLSHSKYSGVRVLRDLRAQRGNQVLAPIVFSCNLGDPLITKEFVQTFGEIRYMISQTPQVWIDLQVFTTADGFTVVCDAVEELFPTGMLDDFFGALIKEIFAAIDSDLAQLGPVDSPGAQARRELRSNVASWKLPDTTLVDQVLATAKVQPDAIAIHAIDGTTMSYRDVVHRARSIATALTNAGVERGNLVAVMVDRGQNQIIGALAVMMAGAAYVPISHQQPYERVAAMLASPRITHTLTDLAHSYFDDLNIRVIDYDEACFTEVNAVNLPKVCANDSAYVIFTSGTTGAPKGVEIRHGAAWNTVAEIIQRIGITGDDCILAVSSFDFDLSVFDIFGLLAAGGSIVTIPHESYRDAEKWLSLVDQYNVSIWNSVPTLFEMLLLSAQGVPQKIDSLRHVLLSGDWIDVGLPARMRAVLPQAHLLAMGGATEASIWSNAFEVDEIPTAWASIPYGRALDGQAYRIVSTNGKDCPDYAVGELWIGGLGVATQYIGDSALTSEKFVLSEGSRWYRTGDMGRFWSDGTIEFLGRADNQVKIRGHRIELGEVETVCESLLPIERAVCLARESGTTQSLIAFAEFTPASTSGSVPQILGHIRCLLDDASLLDSVQRDEELQTSFAISVIRKWQGHLTANESPHAIRKLRNKWQNWLLNSQSDPDPSYPLSDSEAITTLQDFVTPFEQFFIATDAPATPAQFIQSPGVVGIEDFLSARPLGQMIHYILSAIVRLVSRDTDGQIKVVEVGARRPDESMKYREIAGTDSFTILEAYRYYLDKAADRYGDRFDYRQLGIGFTSHASDNKPLTRADLVLCNQSLHQSKDIEQTLREVWSLSAPEATMVIVEPTKPAPLADITAAFISGEFTDFRASTGDMLINIQDWKDALERTGWHLVECIELTDSTTLFLAERAEAPQPTALCEADLKIAKSELSSRLPEYMLPQRIIELSNFPLTANGKVDRKALVAMAPANQETDEPTSELPLTSTEKRLIAIWEELLHASTNADADYFKLGGDSLTATRLRRMIEDEFQIAFPLETIFDSPVLKDMARHIDRVANTRPSESRLPTISHNEDQSSPFPLTEVQQSYVIGSSGAIALGNVSSHCYFEMATPPLDPTRVEESFNTLIERHPMLRTVICPDGLSQRVLPEVPRYKIECLPAGAPATDKAQKQMARQRFDPTQWPSFDIRYVSDDAEGRLLLSFDNLFVDGWSMFQLFKEWKQVYENGPASLGSAAPYSFKDYVEATTELANHEIHERDLNYWQKALESIYPAAQLPVSLTDTDASSVFVRHSFLLPRSKWLRIQQKVRDEGLTEAVFLAEVYAEALARYSEDPKLSINLTRFDRIPFAPEVESIIGDFTSLSILSVDTACELSFRDRAATLQRRMFSNLGHGSVSGVAVQRMLSKHRGTQMTMPVVLTCGLGVIEDSPSQENPYLGVIDHGLSQTPQVWMDLQVYERQDGLMLNLDAVDAIFPVGMVKEIFATISTTIEKLAEDELLWQTPSPNVTSLSNKDYVEDINNTSRQLNGGNSTLLDLYHSGATKHPNRVAVIYKSTKWTYNQLDAESDRWAERIASIQPQAGDLVGILMEKSADQIAAVLGVLKAGCAYLPLHVEHPVARNAVIIRNAGANAVITDRSPAELDLLTEICHIVTADKPTETGDSKQRLAVFAPSSDDLAYVIYTSGTTGTPKGVAISHDAAVNTVLDVNDRLELQPEDIVFGLSQLNFDLSVYDIFGTFARGAALVLPAAEDARNPQHWWELVLTHGVTVWNSVPSLFSMYIQHLSDRSLVDCSIRAALLSGDWIPVDIAQRVDAQFQNCTVFGSGGATEAAIWSNWYKVTKADASRPSIPYGKPLANQRMYILDHSLNIRPIQVPGDLYIAGRGLALGYWRDPMKTAEVFFEHPRTGERMYYTGDQAMYGADGNIIFLGRRDSQVKVNGYRIELGEIESVARRLPEVRDCAAVSDRGIVLCVVSDDRFIAQKLEQHLAALLPGYMCPRSVVPISELPRTWNGKIDRNALHNLKVLEPSDGEGPRDERDEYFLSLVRAQLNISKVSIDDNFFAIGADSLTAVHMTNLIRQKMAVEISIQDVFTHPSARQLSDFIATLIGTDIEEGEI